MADISNPVERLFARVTNSRNADPEGSYTASLFARGRARIAQKLGEEAVEAVIALMRDDPAALVSESADLFYHLAVAWAEAGVTPDQVWQELQRREATGGLAEKAARKPA
jgi:phosphoribosyl-ATP pyrophosphohydrolase